MQKLKTSLSKAKISQGKDRILSELASQPQRQLSVPRYVFECLELLQKQSPEAHVIEEILAFIIASFAYHSEFGSFKQSDLKKLENIGHHWLGEVEGYGIQTSRSYFLVEIYQLKAKSQIRSGDILGASFSIAGLMNLTNTNMTSQDIISLVKDLLEIMLRQLNMEAVADLLKFLEKQSMSVSELQDLKLLELQLTRLAGHNMHSLQEIDKCLMHFELSEENTKKVLWEKLWIECHITGQLHPMIEACFGKNSTHQGATFMMETFLAAHAHRDPRMPSKVFKFDTIRKKFPKEILRQTSASDEVLYEVCQTMEKCVTPQVDLETQLAELEKSLKETIPKLKTHHYLLSLAAYLRWFDRHKMPLLAQIVAKKYMHCCEQLSSSRSHDLLGLVTDLVKTNYQKQIFEDSEPQYIDNLNYSLLGRSMRGVKIGMASACRKFEHAVARIGMDEDGKLRLRQHESEKLKQILLAECNRLKGPALKTAQIIAALTSSETDPFQKYLQGLQEKTSFYNPKFIRQVIKAELGNHADEIHLLLRRGGALVGHVTASSVSAPRASMAASGSVITARHACSSATDQFVIAPSSTLRSRSSSAPKSRRSAAIDSSRSGP